MIRLTIIALLPAVFLMTVCNSKTSQKDKRARFSLVVFDGASSKTIVAGDIAQEDYKKWFTQDYAVGGERIETPKSSNAVGALTIVNGDEILVMPLCIWQTKSGHTIFACQSEAIGQAPMFRVLVFDSVQAEFLKQMESKLGELQVEDE